MASEHKADPLYAIGYEHGLNGKINPNVESDAYFAGQQAGEEARAMFTSAGFEPMGNGSFSVSLTASHSNARTPAEEAELTAEAERMGLIEPSGSDPKE